MARDRDRVMDQFRKLYALADSPELEEARTSALKAIKLIKEHGLEVRWPKDRQEKPPQPQTPTNISPEEALRRWDAFAKKQPQQSQPRYEWPQRGTRKYREQLAMEPKVCKACGQLIIAGDTILIGIETTGVTHERCASYWFE